MQERILYALCPPSTRIRANGARRIKARKCALAVLGILGLLAILTLPNTARAEDTEQAPQATETVVEEARPAIKVGSDRHNMRSATGTVIKGLLYCVAILLLVVSLLQKIATRKESGSSSIEVIARRSIGPKSFLITVNVEGKRLLLSQSGEQVSLLTQLDAEPSDEPENEIASNDKKLSIYG